MLNHLLLNLVPRDARRVLDVGCAAGELGRALKERQPCHVTGVELDPQAAEQARAWFDHVVCGDIAEIARDLPGNYDCIVLGDVLEHLSDPESVLRDLRPLLAEGGKLTLSVPNVRHWSVVRDLLEGRWDYTDKGLLDRTHCHLFTRDSLERALRETGFSVMVCDASALEGVQAPPAIIDALQQAGRLDVSTLGEEAAVYQWLVVAQPDDAPEPLTSIVILAHNLWEQTRTCLQSIVDYTPERHEIIVVDNGSTDETPGRLRVLAETWDNLTVITNDDNRPFAAANNQGIEIARGDYVLLLNNDTVVTPNWLGRMLGVFEEYPQAGIVGPMSNYVAGHQRVPNARYANTEEMLAFASEWSSTHEGEVQ